MPEGSAPHDALAPTDSFPTRHIGPRPADEADMLREIGCRTIGELMDQTIPASIRLKQELRLDGPRGEFEALTELRGILSKNRPLRSLIGMGYSDTITPAVVQRCILENPGWYTQYTPYQAEISQGRLEALLNFQTMVADLTALPLAGASLLDEATAAAEAMHMCRALHGDESGKGGFFVADDCHPQTIAVVRTRARALGLRVLVGKPAEIDFARMELFGVLVQYPTTDGRVEDYSAVVDAAHKAGAFVVAATDLLALTLLKPPGEWGADIAVGNSQRFGVPLGFGGPHAAFLATRDEHKRQMPGRIIGVSRDAHGDTAYRMAIQTREQHIRREKATSNICTAQVLLAIIAGAYATYHGPAGLRRIATRVRSLTNALIVGLEELGHATIGHGPVFDTLRVRCGGGVKAEEIHGAAQKLGYNFRAYADGTVGVSLDETILADDLPAILSAFAGGRAVKVAPAALLAQADARGLNRLDGFARTSAYLSHPVFNSYGCEHDLLRYLKRLESRDLSLTTSMIPLGSCTMKLNAAAEMFPVTWPETARMHPFAPRGQWDGYAAMFAQLEGWLAEITGFDAVSLQPNAGSQGEYAGLLAIRAYHESRRGAGAGEAGAERNVCLIPVSAHGTNPASAVMAGFEVVAVRCDERGNVNLDDLRAKASEHAARLGALMITYPSTHGVFEEPIREICDIVHQHGGQVYMDGANMNAQVGLTRPAEIGADVCHLNLHKTFCIPHGGGGPGVGPIAVRKHLSPFLPSDPLQRDGGSAPSGPVAAAPYGSASILPISWMYIRMMGAEGLRRATEVAILNANYMAARLAPHYPVLYRGARGRLAHEFIIDCRQFEEPSGVKVEDIAKRLMDYGFHAPTMSFPVPGTLMIEPTESESKAELDRLCDALIGIREEIRAIEQGRLSRTDNPLKHAPHTAAAVCASEWAHEYSREQAAYPAAWLRRHKFWPAVGRVDNVWGDRNLFCSCPPL